jgi:surface carbohydrate biosynthesis protein (TIGR04326 family)
MYVPYDGLSYREAARLARGFAVAGERIHLLEEFLTWRGVLRAVRHAARQAWVYLKLRPHLEDGRLWHGFGIPEAAPFLSRLAEESFIGWTGMAALLFLECFNQAFRYWRAAENCIYYMEMHEWEKALNAARRRYAPKVRTIGFQHTHVTRNYFHYHSTADEVGNSAGETGIPMPHVCACNGDIPMAHFGNWRLGNLRRVEAIRHLHLKAVLRESARAGGAGNGERSVVLLAGTIDPEETKGLVSFLLEAFPHGGGGRIWLKGHPSLPIGPVLEELGVDLQDQPGWEIREEPVSNLLAECRVVVVGASAVAIEALAYDCTVVVPVLADCMFMSPLAGFEQHCIKAFSPDDLRHAVMADRDPARQGRESRSFVEKYWCLDESLRSWKELLSERAS